MKAVTFQGNLNRITTTIDGGWRVSFDVPESESNAITKLAARRDQNLQIAVVAVTDVYDSDESEVA